MVGWFLIQCRRDARVKYAKQERDRERHRQTDRDTHRHRQTERQTEGEIQTDRQTDRQGQRETERFVKFCCLGKKKRDISGHASIWTDELIFCILSTELVYMQEKNVPHHPRKICPYIFKT